MFGVEVGDDRALDIPGSKSNIANAIEATRADL
jgi:hypothetical protein